MSIVPKNRLIPLPFDLDALEPYISKETLDFHYNKHHKGYDTALTALIADTEYAADSLEDLIMQHHNSPDQRIYNNAAQVWNHNFYWNSLCPSSQSTYPTEGAFFDAILSKGGFDHVAIELVNAAISQFGSGWAWLVRTEQWQIEVRKTSNAAPVWLNSSDHPLLIVDVWEHAYYLDYQNRRPDYVDTFLTHLVNWDFAATLLNAS